MIVRPLIRVWAPGLVAAGMGRGGSKAAVALIPICALWVVFFIAADGLHLVLHLGFFLCFATPIYGYVQRARLIALGPARLAFGKGDAQQ